MLDVAALAAQVTAIIAPAVPYLLGRVVDAAGPEIRKDVLEQAQVLWTRLRASVEARPAAQEAVDDVSQHPDDPDAQAALRLQLKKLLADDLGLHQELEQMLAAADQRPGASIRVTASGERNVAIGGSNSGTISIDDHSGSRRDR